MPARRKAPPLRVAVRPAPQADVPPPAWLFGPVGAMPHLAAQEGVPASVLPVRLFREVNERREAWCRVHGCALPDSTMCAAEPCYGRAAPRRPRRGLIGARRGVAVPSKTAARWRRGRRAAAQSPTWEQ
jgi:hypothetical protein